MERCPWCGSDPEYIRYHDTEWGVPVHDDRKHFEFLNLEGAQAGLSWLTVLRRRQGYAKAFANFDPQAVAAMGDADMARLLQDASIIRNRAKIRSATVNAAAFIRVQEQYGSFDTYVWKFVGGRPMQNAWKSDADIPASTDMSIALSKDLKSRGFSFVGPTIIYAHMQATGLVNDHVVNCFRYAQLGGHR
ncbi:MAG: DNA-3-methyladenine glycosylase I [Spirochaetia bacterium]